MIDDELSNTAELVESVKQAATSVKLTKRKTNRSSELPTVGPQQMTVGKKTAKGKKDPKKDFYNIVEENHKVSTLFDLKNDPDFQISRNGAIADDYLSLERAVGTSTMLYESLMTSEKQRMTDASQLYEIYGLKQPVEKVNNPHTTSSLSPTTPSSLTASKKTTIYERLHLPFNMDDSILRCLALYEGLEECSNDGSPTLLKRDIYEKCLKTVYGISVTRLKTLLDFVNDMWRGKARAVFGFLAKTVATTNSTSNESGSKIAKYLRKVRSTIINETSDTISDVHKLLEERMPTLECERIKKTDVSKIFESLKETAYNEDIVAVFKKYVFAVQFLATNVFDDGLSLPTTITCQFGYTPEQLSRLHAFYRTFYTTWSTPQRGLTFVEDALCVSVGVDYDGYLQNSADQSYMMMNRVESFRHRVRARLLSVFFGKNSKMLTPAHMYLFASTFAQKSKEPAFRNRCDDAFFLNAYCLMKGVNVNVYCVSTGSKRVVLGRSFERLEPNPEALRDVSLFYNKGKYDILMEYCSTVAERPKILGTPNNHDEVVFKQRSASESKVRFYRTMKSYNSLFTRSLVVNRELQRWVETIATQMTVNSAVLAAPGCSANPESNTEVRVPKRDFEKKIDQYRRSVVKRVGAQKRFESAVAVSKSILYVKHTPKSDEDSSDTGEEKEKLVIKNETTVSEFENVGSDLIYDRVAWRSWSSDLANGIRFTTMRTLIKNDNDDDDAKPLQVACKIADSKSDVLFDAPSQPKLRKFVFLTFPEILVSFGSGHQIDDIPTLKTAATTTNTAEAKKRSIVVTCKNLYRLKALSSKMVDEECVIASYDVPIIYDKKISNGEKRSNYNMIHRYENMTIKRAFEFEPYREDVNTLVTDANAPLSTSSFTVSDDMVKSGLVDRVLETVLARKALSCAREKLCELSNTGEMSFDVAFQVWSHFCKIQISDLDNTTFVLDDDVMMQCTNGKSQPSSASLISDTYGKKLFDVLPPVTSQSSDVTVEKHIDNGSFTDSDDIISSDGDVDSGAYTSDSSSSTYTSDYSSSESDTDSTREDITDNRRDTKIETTHAGCLDNDLFDIVSTMRDVTVKPRKVSKLKMGDPVVYSKSKPTNMTFEAPTKNRNAVSIWIPSECLRDRNIAWSKKESIKNASVVNLVDMCSGVNASNDNNIVERLSLFGDLLDVIANDHRVIVVGVGANTNEPKYDVTIPIVEDRKKYAYFSDMEHLFTTYAAPDYFHGCSPAKYYAFAYRRYAEQKLTSKNDSKTHNNNTIVAKAQKPETTNIGGGGGGFWGYVFGSTADAADTSSALKNENYKDDVVNSVKNQVDNTTTALLNMGESLLDYVSAHSKKKDGHDMKFLRRCLHSNGFIVSVIFPKSEEISSIVSDSNISINATYLRAIQSTVSNAMSLLDRDEL